MACRLLRARSDGAVRVRVFESYGVLLALLPLVVAATEVGRAIRLAPGVVWHWLLLAAVLAPTVWLAWAALRTPRVVTFEPGRGVQVASLLRRWTVPASSVRTIDVLRPSPFPFPRRAVTPDHVRLILDVPADAVLPTDLPRSFTLRADDGGRPATILAVFDLRTTPVVEAFVAALAVGYPEAVIERQPVLAQRPTDTAGWTIAPRLELPGGRAPVSVLAPIVALAVVAGVVGFLDGATARDVRRPASTPFAEVLAELEAGADGGLLEGAPVPTSVVMTACRREDRWLWGDDPSTRDVDVRFVVALPTPAAAAALEASVGRFDPDARVRGYVDVDPDGPTPSSASVWFSTPCMTDPPDGWPAMQDELVSALRRLLARRVAEASAT